MLTNWEVTIPVTVTVYAESREEAISVVSGSLEADTGALADESKAKVKHLWHETAEEMLKDGASYRQVEETIGVGRQQIAKVFPGYGWTRQQGVEYRELKKLADEATL